MKALFKADKGRLRKKKAEAEEEKEGSLKSAGYHRMQTDMSNLELPGE